MDIQSLMHRLEAKHPGENEYLQAVQEVLRKCLKKKTTGM